MKCDERKPVCRNCQKSKNKCVWPLRNQSLPHTSDFNIKKVQSNGLALKFLAVNHVSRFRNCKVLGDESQERMPTSISLDQRNMEIRDDGLFRRYLREHLRNLIGKSQMNCFTNCMTDDLHREDAIFYDAFVNGFMVSVSPMLAHKNLQPGAIFVPPGLYNSTLRSIFYACGAAFLCWNRESEMREVAEAKYAESLVKLRQFFDTEPIRGNENILVIALLSLILREKYCNENMIVTTCHTVAALDLIRQWQLNKRFPRLNGLYPQDSEPGLKQFFDKVITDSGGGRAHDENARTFHLLMQKLRPQLLQNTSDTQGMLSPEEQHGEHDNQDGYNMDVSGDMDIRYRILSSDCPVTDSLSCISVEAAERTLVESFLYNYTMNIFTCGKDVIEYVSSPFQVFDVFRRYLSGQLYTCPVPWMNNPVMGAAVPAFEIAAKTNWLALLYPFNSENREIALSLLNSARYYARPLLPPDLKENTPPSVQKKLMESCFLGDMIATSSVIYLKKLLWPDTTPEDTEIRDCVAAFFNNLHNLSFQAQIACIASWPLAIAGAALTLKEEQDYLIWRLQNFCSIIRSQALPSVMAYLREVWNGGGYDTLLERKYFNYLSV